MTTVIEYALMAGASYISNRAELNRFPVPDGWIEAIDERQAKPSGFEATYFTKGTEIVISFAGTEPTQLGDLATNLSLAAGGLCDQLRQAADYYLQVKASAPAGTKVSLTGHSLGGGLASLIAVMFGESAFTFDQAPFVRSALSSYSTIPESGDSTTHSAVIDLQAYLAGRPTNDALLKLDAYITANAPFNPSPNPADTLSARGAYVINFNTQGEFITEWFPIPSSNRIGSQTEIRNSSSGVGGLDMHSQALLTAFLQSNQSALTDANGQVQSMSEVTFKLPDLLKMVFDSKLYAFTTGMKWTPSSRQI